MMAFCVPKKNLAAIRCARSADKLIYSPPPSENPAAPSSSGLDSVNSNPEQPLITITAIAIDADIKEKTLKEQMETVTEIIDVKTSAALPGGDNEEISLTRLTPIIIVKNNNDDIDQLLSIAGHSFKVTREELNDIPANENSEFNLAPNTKNMLPLCNPPCLIMNN